MPVEVNITDDDIAFAERLLLPEGKTFDDERRAFIRRLDTLDLQAVPGSGKTTALLAKLVILDRHLPFEDGSAILVISHTNAAVDEIHTKIGAHCQRLFSYPNYVGTIQRFVDRFLAIPYYVSRRKRRPTRIDNEIYSEAMSRFRQINFPRNLFSAAEQNRGRHYLLGNEKLSTVYRLSLVGDDVKLTRGVCGQELTVSKPRGRTLQQNYYDWSEEEKGRVESWLKKLKLRILDAGVLCYDDAYFLADCYVSRMPKAKALIQSRFRFVFVDEMQDMGKHQYELLEQLFFDNGDCSCAYQRIGDRNQAIHDSRDFNVESGWQDRETVLSLSNSCRLSALTAKAVETFALHRESEFEINGLGDADIKPHLILYDDASLKAVIQRFSSLLSDLILEGRVPKYDRHPFTAVAWTSGANDEDNSERTGVRLTDYCSSFQKATNRPPVDHEYLEAYLRYFDRSNQTLGAARSSILKAFLKVLRLEDVRNPDTGRDFTAGSLLKHLRYYHPDLYEDFKLRLYRWSVAAIRGDTHDSAMEMRAKGAELLQRFAKTIDGSRAFLDRASTELSAADNIKERCLLNKVNFHGFDIELATVHSVKGQTHTATLYLETYFYKDGSGVSAKSYESQRLAGQFLLNPLNGKEGTRIKQSAKMVYVGFSRPTHLLCFAVHKDRFDQYLTTIDRAIWEIIRLDDENRGVS